MLHTPPLSGRNHAAGAIFRPLVGLAALLLAVLCTPDAAMAQAGSGTLKGKSHRRRNRRAFAVRERRPLPEWQTK